MDLLQYLRLNPELTETSRLVFPRFPGEIPPRLYVDCRTEWSRSLASSRGVIL